MDTFPWDEPDGFIGLCRNMNRTITETIKAYREKFECSLAEAKRVVSAHPAYAAVHAAAAQLHAEAEAVVQGDLWLEYVCEEHGLCGLCGNTGAVETHILTSAGVNCGIRGHCICPNGRKKKEQKWPL